MRWRMFGCIGQVYVVSLPALAVAGAGDADSARIQLNRWAKPNSTMSTMPAAKNIPTETKREPIQERRLRKDRLCDSLPVGADDSVVDIAASFKQVGPDYALMRAVRPTNGYGAESAQHQRAVVARQISNTPDAKEQLDGWPWRRKESVLSRRRHGAGSGQRSNRKMRLTP
jgi:hypothetical protein